MKRFLIIAVFLLTTAGVGWADGFKPENAIPFEYDELDVNRGICQRIEFSKKKMNLTLKNKTESPQNVRLKVSVLNPDGIVIYEAKEIWIINRLEPEAKFAKDFDFQIGMPAVLKYSKYAPSFDMTPAWIIIEDI